MIVGHNFCRLETYFPMFEWVWFWRRYKGRSSVFRPGQDVSIVPFSPEPWIINSKSAANWFELSRTTFVFPPQRKLWSDGKCQSGKFYSSMSATRVCCMLFLHEYFWLQPTGNTQAEYVLIGLTSIRIEMKSSDILSVGLTAAWKRTNFRPSVSIQPPPSPADEQISGTQQSVCVAILQWSTHIPAPITGEPWACSGQEAIM